MKPQAITEYLPERERGDDGMSIDVHGEPVQALSIARRHSSNEPIALWRPDSNLEHQILALMPSAVIRGPQSLAEAGLIENAKGPLQVAVIGIKSEVKDVGDVRCISHSAEWRRVLNSHKALVQSGSDEHPLPRMNGASALAEMLLMEIEHSPDVEEINFKVLSPVQKMLFRRLTGLLHAGPLPEAYKNFRYRHLLARRNRIK